ncbi:uncharacterized protein [Amphiura filiformis]|uniref:uncharacterized protein isoform X2 n=1 Tax=Amphiura filiformis TaxID=82378 RepID=UPI003B2243C1
MSWRRRSPSSSLSNVAKYLRSSTRSTTSTGWTSGALSSPLSSRSSSASLLSPSSASSLPSSRSSSSSSRSAPPSPKLSLTIPSRRSSSRDRDSLSSPTSPSLARGSSPSRSRDSISSPTSPALARSSPRSRDSISSPTSPALARPSLRSRDSPSLARSSTSRRSPPTSPTSPSVPRSSPATLPRYSPSSPMSPSLPRSSASTSRRSPSSPTSPTASLKFGHGSSRSNGPSYPNRDQHSSGIEERRRMRREHEERRQKLEDCGLQLSHTGTYLDLESSIDEQKEDFVGFNREFRSTSGGSFRLTDENVIVRSRKHSVIIRTDLSVRVHACIEKLLNSTGRELRRALFSLKQIFQDDQDLVHEFVSAEGLACLIKVGSSADQNYQNYILRALGQVMLYVDGMNGVIEHNETIQWLYSLIASKYRLVLKTALKLLVVFIEYAESNAQLLLQAVDVVDKENMQLPWANVMKLLTDDGQDSEVLVYAMTLVNKTVHNIPDQDTFYDLTDALEQQGIEVVTQRYMGRAGSDLDLVEQLRIYEMGLKQEDGDIDIPVSQQQNLRKTPRKSLDPSENGHARKSIRHSLRPTAEYDVKPKRRSLDASMDEMQNGSSRRRRRRPRYSADEGQPPVLAETTPTEESKPPLSNGTEALIGSLEERRERIRAARQRDNQSRDKNGTTTPTKQSNGEIPMVNGESVNQQAETHPRRTSQPNRSLPETNGASHPKRSSSSSDAESKEDQFEMRRMRRRLQYLQTKNHDHKSKNDGEVPQDEGEEKSLKDQEFESNTWPRRRRRCHQIEAIKEESREEEDEDVSIADGETEQDVSGPSASKVRRSSNPSLTSHTSLEEPMEISKPTETPQDNERLAGKEEKEEETVDVEEKLKTGLTDKMTKKQEAAAAKAADDDILLLLGRAPSKDETKMELEVSKKDKSEDKKLSTEEDTRQPSSKSEITQSLADDEAQNKKELIDKEADHEAVTQENLDKSKTNKLKAQEDEAGVSIQEEGSRKLRKEPNITSDKDEDVLGLLGRPQAQVEIAAASVVKKDTKDDDILELLGRSQAQVETAAASVVEKDTKEGSSTEAKSDGLGLSLPDTDGNRTASDAASQSSQSSDSEGYLSALSEEDAENSSASVLAMLQKGGDNAEDEAKFTIAPDEMMLPGKEVKKDEAVDEEDILTYLGKGENANSQANKNRWTMKGKRQSSDAFSETSASDEGLAEVGSSTGGDVAQNGDNGGGVEKEDDIMAMLGGGVKMSETKLEKPEMDLMDKVGIAPTDAITVLDADVGNQDRKELIRPGRLKDLTETSKEHDDEINLTAVLSKSKKSRGKIEDKSANEKDVKAEPTKTKGLRGLFRIKSQEKIDAKKDATKSKKEMKKQKAIDNEDEANMLELLGRRSKVSDGASGNSADVKDISTSRDEKKTDVKKSPDQTDDDDGMSLFGRSIMSPKRVRKSREFVFHDYENVELKNDDKADSRSGQSKKRKEEENDIMALLSGGIQRKSSIKNEKEVEEKKKDKKPDVAGLEKVASKKKEEEAQVEQKDTDETPDEVIKDEIKQKPMDDEDDVLRYLGRRDKTSKMSKKNNEDADVLALLGQGVDASLGMPNDEKQKDVATDVAKEEVKKEEEDWKEKDDTTDKTKREGEKDDDDIEHEESTIVETNSEVKKAYNDRKVNDEVETKKEVKDDDDDEAVTVVLVSPRVKRKANKDAKSSQDEDIMAMLGRGGSEEKMEDVEVVASIPKVKITESKSSIEKDGGIKEEAKKTKKPLLRVFSSEEESSFVTVDLKDSKKTRKDEDEDVLALLGRGTGVVSESEKNEEADEVMVVKLPSRQASVDLDEEVMVMKLPSKNKKDATEAGVKVGDDEDVMNLLGRSGAKECKSAEEDVLALLSQGISATPEEPERKVEKEKEEEKEVKEVKGEKDDKIADSEITETDFASKETGKSIGVKKETEEDDVLALLGRGASVEEVEDDAKVVKEPVPKKEDSVLADDKEIISTRKATTEKDVSETKKEDVWIKRTKSKASEEDDVLAMLGRGASVEEVEDDAKVMKEPVPKKEDSVLADNKEIVSTRKAATTEKDVSETKKEDVWIKRKIPKASEEDDVLAMLSQGTSEVAVKSVNENKDAKKKGKEDDVLAMLSQGTTEAAVEKSVNEDNKDAMKKDKKDEDVLAMLSQGTTEAAVEKSVNEDNKDTKKNLKADEEDVLAMLSQGTSEAAVGKSVNEDKETKKNRKADEEDVLALLSQGTVDNKVTIGDKEGIKDNEDKKETIQKEDDVLALLSKGGEVEVSAGDEQTKMKDQKKIENKTKDLADEEDAIALLSQGTPPTAENATLDEEQKKEEMKPETKDQTKDASGSSSREPSVEVEDVELTALLSRGNSLEGLKLKIEMVDDEPEVCFTLPPSKGRRKEDVRVAEKQEDVMTITPYDGYLYNTFPRSKLSQKQNCGSLSPRPFESPWAQQESSDSSFSQCTPFAPTSSLYGDIARWAHVANPKPVYIRRPSYIIRDPRTGKEMTPDGKPVELKSKTHEEADGSDLYGDENAKRLLGDQKDVKAKTQDRPWKTKLAQRMEEEKKREEAKKAKLKEMEEMRKAKEQERARQFKKDMGSLSSRFEGKEGDKSGGSKGTGDKATDAAPLRKKTSDEDSPWRKKLMEKLEEDKRKTEERRKKQQARLEEERKKREEERKRDEERRKEERGKKKKWNELVQSRLEEEQKKAEQEQKKKQELKKKAEPKVEEKLSENKTEELKPWEKRLAARLEKERQLEEEKKKKEEAEKMLRDAKILEKLAETGEELKPWQKRLAARLAEQQKEADAKKESRREESRKERREEGGREKG